MCGDTLGQSSTITLATAYIWRAFGLVPENLKGGDTIWLDKEVARKHILMDFG